MKRLLLSLKKSPQKARGYSISHKNKLMLLKKKPVCYSKMEFTLLLTCAHNNLDNVLEDEHVPYENQESSSFLKRGGCQ